MATALPGTMQVIELREPGGPENLYPATRSVPKVKPGQIVIRVAAAGINRPDVLQRQGLYKVPEDASDLLGLEVAGTVAAVGDGVTRWSIGDR